MKIKREKFFRGWTIWRDGTDHMKIRNKNVLFPMNLLDADIGQNCQKQIKHYVWYQRMWQKGPTSTDTIMWLSLHLFKIGYQQIKDKPYHLSVYNIYCICLNIFYCIIIPLSLSKKDCLNRGIMTLLLYIIEMLPTISSNDTITRPNQHFYLLPAKFFRLTHLLLSPRFYTVLKHWNITLLQTSSYCTLVPLSTPCHVLFYIFKGIFQLTLAMSVLLYQQLQSKYCILVLFIIFLPFSLNRGTFSNIIPPTFLSLFIVSLQKIQIVNDVLTWQIGGYSSFSYEICFS